MIRAIYGVLIFWAVSALLITFFWLAASFAVLHWCTFVPEGWKIIRLWFFVGAPIAALIGVCSVEDGAY